MYTAFVHTVMWHQLFKTVTRRKLPKTTILVHKTRQSLLSDLLVLPMKSVRVLFSLGVVVDKLKKFRVVQNSGCAVINLYTVTIS